MANLNKVILAGNLTRDPDARRTNSGTSLCKLGMAVNRRFKTQSGEQRDEALFVDVDVWGKQADFCRDYLRRGSPVLIEGRLRMDSWEDKTTGQQRSKLLVVAEQVQSLASRDGGSQQSGGGAQQGGYDQGGAQQPENQQSSQPQQSAPQAPAPPPFPSAPQAQPQGQANVVPPAGDAFDVSDESIDDIPF